MSYDDMQERLAELERQCYMSPQQSHDESAIPGSDEYCLGVDGQVIRMRPGVSLSIFASPGCGTTYLEEEKAVIMQGLMSLFTGNVHFFKEVVWKTCVLNPKLCDVDANFLLASPQLTAAITGLCASHGIPLSNIESRRVFGLPSPVSVLGANPGRIIDVLKDAGVDVSRCFGV